MFGQKKNKRFTYNSQFLGDDKIERKGTLKSELSSEWKSARRTGTSARKSPALLVLLILLAVIIAAMYFLDAKLR